MRHALPPAWATNTEHDDDGEGWIHTADLPAGAVMVQLIAWQDDHDPAQDETTVTIGGTLSADPVALLRLVDAFSRAAGLLLTWRQVD